MERASRDRQALERRLMAQYLLRLNRCALEREAITPEIYHKLEVRIRAGAYGG